MATLTDPVQLDRRYTNRSGDEIYITGYGKRPSRADYFTSACGQAFDRDGRPIIGRDQDRRILVCRIG